MVRAGIHLYFCNSNLDPGLRRDDEQKACSSRLDPDPGEARPAPEEFLIRGRDDEPNQEPATGSS
jgi:hypothetical protein